MSIKHSFTSAKGDPPDATIIGATKWNAAHSIEAGTIVNADLAAAADVLNNPKSQLFLQSDFARRYIGGISITSLSENIRLYLFHVLITKAQPFHNSR